MNIIILIYFLFSITIPARAVTTKMFKVLDTCARYRLKEIDSLSAIEKLKLKYSNNNKVDSKEIVRNYCSVFTPNEKIEF